LDKNVTQYPILFIGTPTFIYKPITENEVECFIKNLKGKFSAGCDEIPEYVVKLCEVNP
jgi:hypothetical protein